MNICGKLSAVPLLDPPNDEILEIGTLYGMLGAALIRMMERAGRDPTTGLAVDGKTARGSRTDGHAVHLLAAALHDSQTVIAQREHAHHIVAVGGHNLLVVKDNQKKLCKQIKRLPWSEIPFAGRTTTTGHARREIRQLKEPHPRASRPRPPGRTRPGPLVGGSPASRARRHLRRRRLPDPRRYRTPPHGHPSQPRHRPEASGRPAQHRRRTDHYRSRPEHAITLLKTTS